MGDRAGQRLDNYRLIRLLGAGSFGEVYLAEHVYRKNQVAVKVLPQLSDKDLPDFLNEARTIRLRHPHIVQVLDFGVDNRIPFIVMEYISNGTLRERYPKGTQLPLDIIVSYVKQVASALQYAHDEKLIHRDVKPENVLVRTNNEVLLSDFGIATMARSSRSQSVQEMAGTVAYMAPEQLQGKPVVASDQYALGVVVYEWLCGERPFNGGPMEIATQHMVVPPPSLRPKMPLLSPDIGQVVLTALEKEPNKRFASVQAFANALEQAYKPKAPVPAVSKPVTPLPIVPSVSSLPKEPPFVVAPVLSDHVSNPAPNPSLPVSEKSLLPAFLQSVISSTFPLPKPIASSPPLDRLFYPTLGLIVLLVVALVGSGAFYFLRLSANANTAQAVQAAQQLIAKANAEMATNPVLALQDLATAQSNLRSLQNAQLTDAQRTQVIHLLQMNLPTTVKSAISSYNTQSSITALCGNTPANAISGVKPNTQLKSLATANSSLYGLGTDHTLYQLTNTHLTPAPLPNKAPVLTIGSDGSQLALLWSQGTAATTSYGLSVQSSAPAKLDSTQVSPSLIKSGQIPMLISIRDTDVYLVLTSTATPNNVTILDYPLSAGLFAGPPLSSSLIVSQTLMSVAAFPNHQLFLLLADGSVQSFVATAKNTQSPSVFVQHAIALPLTVSAQDFTWQTPVPTTTPVAAAGTPPLSIPANAGSGLVSGVVHGVPYLYLMDVSSHRFLELKMATPSATSGGQTALESNVPLQLVQQYSSSTLLAQMKSLAVTGSGQSILAQSPQNPATQNLVSVSASPQSGCA